MKKAASSWKWKVAALLAYAAAAAAATAPAAGTRPSTRKIELTCVDDNATGYATFQSHNQKVVSNVRGIFMSYIRTRNEPYTAQQWRLLWSTDKGRTFRTLHEATHATNPPVLETDKDANIYLIRVNFVSGDAYLYRFLAKDDYAQPLISTIPGGAAGKYSMMYDGPRQQLYLFNFDTFHVIGLDGQVHSRTRLLISGRDADPQYPLLSLTREGVLHTAWTTVKKGKYLYWDIHHMLSRDGGQSWQTMTGSAVTLPVAADQTGTSDRITLDDEYEVHTWLSSFLAREGHVHFVYSTQSAPPRQHYVRYDLDHPKQRLDIAPEFKGDRISLLGLDGFFASQTGQSGAPLYCVLGSAGRLGCLVSRDQGQTWQDHAISQETMNLYSIGGCREVTADGAIIGSFTDSACSDPGGRCRVYFFRIPGLGTLPRN